MQFSFNIISIVLFALSIPALLMAGFVINKLRSSARWFGYIMIATVIWAMAYAFELGSFVLPQILFWLKVKYIGISILPALWVTFVFKYSSRDHWLKPKYVLAIWLIPVITIISVWTNLSHHLHYSGVSIEAKGNIAFLKIDPSVGFYVYALYFYVLMGMGIYLLISRFKKTRNIYRKQILIILIASIIPALANLLYLAGVRPLGHLEITPFVILLIEIWVGIILLRSKLFNMIPVARDKVIEAMQEGLLVIDSQGRIIDCNTKMALILDKEKKEIFGTGLKAVLPNTAVVEKLLDKEYEGDIDIHFDKEEASTDFEITCKTLMEGGALFRGRLFIFRDITEYNKARVKLQEQAKELKELNELKDRILTIVSHDMRTPLSSLTQVLNMSDKGFLSEGEIRDLLPQISTNLESVTGFMENLLFWAKSQLKGTTIKPVVFDISQEIETNLALFESLLERKEISVIKLFNNQFEVFADQDMQRLVIRNLLNNAIKFCNKGDSIFFDLEENANEVILSIKDTGVGIAEENLNKIFSPGNFSTYGTENEQGNGIGLLLSKDFVEKNGGRIWAESEIGEGTTFFFSVPKAPENVPVLQYH